jgi:predicted N-acyltransferase
MSQILLHYIDEINQMEKDEIDAINQDLPFSKQEINLQF